MSERISFEVVATGKRLINEAFFVLSSDQIGLQIKLGLIQALPGIIEKSVEPMKRIEGIKIVQVDGLTRPAGVTNGSGRGGAMGHSSLAEQAVAAALAYRAQSPIIDSLLKEIGMSSGTLAGLTQSAATEPQSSPTLPAESKSAVNLDKLESTLISPPLPKKP